MDLDEELYQKVTVLSEDGNNHFDKEEWEQAIKLFYEALGLLPKPVTQWEAALWLNASIGDAFFQEGSYAAAKEALLDALNCPDGHNNPFVQLRLGETLYELDDTEGAKEHLLRSYMLEGIEVFEDEDAKYLSFLEKFFNLD